MKERLYETDDGKFTYSELKAASSSWIEWIMIRGLDVNQEVSLGTCGTIKRIQ